MPRDIPIGNGSLTIAYDRQGLVRDIYYPFSGMENHAQGHAFRVGAWVNGAFSWVDGEGWERALDYEDETMVATITLTSPTLGVRLLMRDVVDFHEDVYVREIRAGNLNAHPVELRLFFNSDFHIYGTEIGDTACYKPEARGLLHYKGRRYFLMGASGERGIEHFATGAKEAKGLTGTWKDAEDGALSGNPIAQGSVDSTFAVHMGLPPRGEAVAHTWMAAGADWKSVERLDRLVRERSPAYFIKRTRDYWRFWSGKERLNFGGLPDPVVRLYQRSLLILRTNINENGSVIAANDSDSQHYYKDTYSYFWPRDGAIVAHALDLAGYPVPSRRFFEFCGAVIGRNGFFFHKYNPDGSLASSWHPWVLGGQPSLPIQEDETGLVLWALWEHFRRYRDIEFIKPFYRKLVKAGADFMCGFTDPVTGLPMPSYDLWEERLGVHAFTVCCVMAGLRAAAGFTEAFGETELSEKYRGAAEKMGDAMAVYLFDREKGRFLRTAYREPDGVLRPDPALDASLFALSLFKAFPPDDKRVEATAEALRSALWCRTDIGGMARYENDSYQAAVRPSAEAPGNPWITSTLWLARHIIERAPDEEGLKEAVGLMEWAAARALPSGVLPEQISPLTGEPLSVSPLTWSHAEFVITVQSYLDRLEQLRTCPHCGHPAFVKVEAQAPVVPGTA